MTSLHDYPHAVIAISLGIFTTHPGANQLAKPSLVLDLTYHISTLSVWCEGSLAGTSVCEFGMERATKDQAAHPKDYTLTL